MIICSGLIITGGTSSGSKVELYNPVSGSSCSLPDLPDFRSGHHQCGDLLCSATSCLVRYNSQRALYKILDIIFLIECLKPSSSPLVGQYRKLYSLVNQIQPMLIESALSQLSYLIKQ